MRNKPIRRIKTREMIRREKLEKKRLKEEETKTAKIIRDREWNKKVKRMLGDD